jgi:hypothetical protein
MQTDKQLDRYKFMMKRIGTVITNYQYGITFGRDARDADVNVMIALDRIRRKFPEQVYSEMIYKEQLEFMSCMQNKLGSRQTCRKNLIGSLDFLLL